jgi:hypothetical protein
MRCATILLLVVGVGALRKKQSQNGTNSDMFPRGIVSQLYTYGAPKVSAPALSNPNADDGCFPGFRIVNKRKALIYDTDVVPALMKTLPYEHPRIDPIFLFQDGTNDEKECGWRGRTIEQPNVAIHDMLLYIERASLVRELEDASVVALAVSYESDLEAAASWVRERGYGLVGSALDETDEVSHLIQNPRTLDCFLTFEGSDEFGDWVEDIQIRREPFCGLEQPVHRGFKKATTEIVSHETFKQNVRPFLGHCRKVTALGHSLGGAIGYLFTACTHNMVNPGEEGYEEFQHFWFQKKDTLKLDYK